MTISPLDLLVLLGSLQGFILAVVLVRLREGNRLANRLLAGLLGLMALASLGVSVPITHRWVGLLLDFFPFYNIMLLGPLLYFYVKAVLDPAFRLGKSEWRQLVPVVLDWGAKLIGWTFLAGLLVGAVSKEQGPAWGHWMNQYETYADLPRWISMTVYLLLSRQWLHRQAMNERETEPQNIRWLQGVVTLFLMFQGVWLLHLVPTLIPSMRSAALSQFGWYPLYIPIAVLIYYLGFKGYVQTLSPAVSIARKPSSTTLAEETVQAVLHALTKAMAEDKLYLDPELTVQKVSQHTGQPAKSISFVLNQHQQKSFNLFVNEYRIEAFKQRLYQDPLQQLTLTGLAFECGYNSQATFQRTFKQMTGLTPRAYLKRQTP
ncbi:AraC family transcriptional regulator [Siphonobacter sp. BAB-5385]|uniref:helix-turn-helix domain-containing protein n=1 Tax=Siphonobacter sp. BAB-5385 TaxID=1864822 RepID=UPI000B9E7C28|nr:helix-turn-helix domain-containing protein [Siphonobacter sp. BAB-5385]OZI06836.1 AraC family transcriptional regulator [Siphonobacter sp. BAB-5385]